MKKLLIIIIAVVVLLIIAAVAGFMMLSGGSSMSEEGFEEEGEGEVVETVQEPYYLEIRPPFVVTLTDESDSYFLQVETAILAYSQENFDALEKNQPAIKSVLVDLYSEQDVNYVKTKEGRDALRAQALTQVKEVMLNAYGQEAAEEIYFTKYVIQ